MAVSRNPPERTDKRGDANSVLDGLSRYDLVLALVPVGFALSLLAHVVLGVPVLAAVAGGAMFGILVLVDALFVNPPSGNPPGDAR